MRIVAIGELETGVVIAGDPALRAARLRRLTAVFEAAVIVVTIRPATQGALPHVRTMLIR